MGILIAPAHLIDHLISVAKEIKTAFQIPHQNITDSFNKFIYSKKSSWNGTIEFDSEKIFSYTIQMIPFIVESCNLDLEKVCTHIDNIFDESQGNLQIVTAEFYVENSYIYYIV